MDPAQSLRISSKMLLLFSIVCITNTCKKNASDYNTLPPITQEGKGTLGFKVNGVVWVPHNPCSAVVLSPPACELEYQIEPLQRNSYGNVPILFSLLATRIDNNTETEFQVLQEYGVYFSKEGNVADSLNISYGLNDNTNSGSSFSLNYGPGVSNLFQVTKIDTIRHFISGIFQFNLVEKNNGVVVATLAITDGRFDLPFGSKCTCSHN